MDDPPPPYTDYGYKPETTTNPHGQALPTAPQPPGFQQYPPVHSMPPSYGATGHTAYPQNYGATQYPTVTVQPVSQVIIVGGCPACRVGVLEDDYTCCGLFCAIFCFPLGILWCMATKQRRCPNCGAIFG